ncbi:hypothetical protein IRJ41_019343 [Triplophysa rosa]|uniref:Uncharacterized protein n=1 Tax=Triplophysa rosa TaxID=992332 RepID=A0A9W7WHU9_TRIRA|nr:hypothetical protein IRJ41_019343 [Triplophysa rosa]
MAFFREAMDSLFILTDVTATQADVEAQQVIPDTRDTQTHYARFLARINPEDGKKCTSRQGVSKKTGKVVQRKAVAINPHVNSFMQSLMEFEWKTSN